MSATYTFEAEPWLFHTGGWVFVTLPFEQSQQIREANMFPRKGFGSRRVEVKIGESTWNTSLFPEAKTGQFVLPLKKDIRRTEGISVGEMVQITLSLVDLL